MHIVLSREEVYKLIDAERDYQDKKWNDILPDNGDHSLEEWLMYIDAYMADAKHSLVHEMYGCEKVQIIMRKIAALSVAAIENCGAPPRGPQ